MRTRSLLFLAIAAATLLTNVLRAGNIAHGVEVVVIDAGHGGKFPGAHYGGVYEKDLTLKVALKLGRLIEEGMPGVKVVYTRKTAKAAAARGVETLIMGESPKEQRYNENALYESNREDLIDMSDERTAAIVRAYIQNLQFTYGEYSMALARCIQNNYIKSGRRSRGVKPQLLRVLYATDMPGVLTEIGFMTNSQEMAYMKSEKGQQEIARNIYQGIRDYSDYVLRTRRAGEAEAARTERERPEEASAAASGTAAKEAAASGGGSASKPSGKDAAAASGAGTKAAAKDGGTKQAGTKQAAARRASEPLRYTIQVLASAKPLPVRSSQFRSYRGKVKQYTSEGRFPYKYCVGEYDDRAAAQRRLREVRRVFPDAFVVGCRGSRIVK